MSENVVRSGEDGKQLQRFLKHKWIKTMGDNSRRDQNFKYNNAEIMCKKRRNDGKFSTHMFSKGMQSDCWPNDWL